MILRLNEADNVGVAISEIASGATVSQYQVTARSDIPKGHKMALSPISIDDPVIKYGQIIGYASASIEPGDHVHTSNVSMAEFDRDYAYSIDAQQTAFVPEPDRARFMGYRRRNGRIGTRNYIGIVTSVNCSATVARHFAREVEKRDLLAGYANIDGVVPLTHGAGCCVATDDEQFAMLQRTIKGYAGHPNFAAVLLLGLGCETNQISLMTDEIEAQRGGLVESMTIQESGGTHKTVDRALTWLEKILPVANDVEREPAPLSELNIALQCGGSDGYSGITANPALGLAVDQLVRHGGTAALGETPEIYGAEHLLTRRASSPEIGEKLIGMIRWWEGYAKRNNSAMNNNPTPGNKAGGLTTILEKSLGAVAKAGSTNLNGVYQYAEPITAKGLVFVDSPGYDPCSLTGQVASGCNLICFTTGRGSVYGNKPVPSLKIATNSEMYQRMSEDMDIDCGGIVDGSNTLPEMGQDIFDSIIKVASGEQTKSEINDFGDSEFVPWQIGAQM
jgi:altronate hydrolase